MIRAISRLALMISLGASRRSVSLWRRSRNRLVWVSRSKKVELLVGLLAEFGGLAHDSGLILESNGRVGAEGDPVPGRFAWDLRIRAWADGRRTGNGRATCKRPGRRSTRATPR